MITYTYKALDHKSTCTGDKICPTCGRKTCFGCRYPNGECVICNGSWKEENIILYQPKLWDGDNNAQ